MANWTWLEWLLVQALLLACFGCLGLGAAFQMNKSRVQRLQGDFKKLASSMGDAISKAASEGGVQFDALLIQTQAYLKSEGLSVPWQDVDPLHYPHLISIFLRSAVLELEHEVYGDMNESDYWPKLSKSYEKILFQFNKDGQASSVDSVTWLQQSAEQQQLVISLRERIAVLEPKLDEGEVRGDALSSADHSVSQNKDQVLFDEYSSSSSEVSLEHDYEKVLSERAAGNTDEGASEFQIKMLSNIIDDQKERIRSLQSDIKRAESSLSKIEPSGLNLKKQETLILELKDENEQLAGQLSVFEKTVASKEQELSQLLEQMDATVSLSPPTPVLAQESGDDIAIRKALVEAWMATEASLVKLEQQLLAQRSI